MELNVGDLVLHCKNENIGYGLVLSPAVAAYGSTCCTVQWITSGYKHTIDVYFLKKITKDKK